MSDYSPVTFNLSDGGTITVDAHKAILDREVYSGTLLLLPLNCAAPLAHSYDEARRMLDRARDPRRAKLLQVEAAAMELLFAVVDSCEDRERLKLLQSEAGIDIYFLPTINSIVSRLAAIRRDLAKLDAEPSQELVKLREQRDVLSTLVDNVRFHEGVMVPHELRDDSYRQACVDAGLTVVLCDYVRRDVGEHFDRYDSTMISCLLADIIAKITELESE